MKKSKYDKSKSFRNSIKELCSDISRQMEENAEKEYIKKKLKKEHNVKDIGR